MPKHIDRAIENLCQSLPPSCHSSLKHLVEDIKTSVEHIPTPQPSAAQKAALETLNKLLEQLETKKGSP